MSCVVDLEKLQKKTLEILVKVDSLCKKYGIKYYLVYGTALGAIRHRGFIPWDDDIDICMFRDEFEKFKAISHELGEEFFFQTRETDPNYPLELPKIRMNNTAFVEENIKSFDINHGIFIDVFILEYSLKNKLLDKFTQRLYMFDIYNIRNHVPTQKSSRIMFKMLRPFLYKGKLKKWWQNDVYTKLKKDYEICNDIVSFGYSFPTSDFGEPRYVVFEDILLPVPSNVENHLLKCYGDYMKLPKEKDRIPHHNTIYFSTKNSYNIKGK